MSIDDRWCNGIALHDFAIENVKWKEWFDYNLAIFTKHNLEPTRLGMEGKPYGYSVKSLTFKGGYKKLEKYNFEDLENLVFMAMPNKDDFTSNFIINVALYPNLKEPRESFITITIDEKLQPLVQEQIEQIASALQQLTGAKYGYHYHKHLKDQAGIYAMGSYYNYHADKEQVRLCNKWKFRCSREYDHYLDYYSRTYIGPYFTGNIRDIYKLNFLSKENLAWQITEQHNLESWILADAKHSMLKELAAGFWSWYVDEEMIPSVRQALIPSGIIICA